jgi:tetratricopeptide (TPR) repeat protein
MITEFKQTGGFARGLFAVLLVALGGLTFTRAADESKPASTNSPQPPSAAASDPILTAGYDTNALEAFIDEQIQKTIRETYYGNRDRLIKSLHEKGTTYEAWRRGQREYWIVRLMREQIAMIEDLKQADAALKVDPDNESLRRLKAEIGQREAEQLGRVPGPDMLKRAPGLEQEKIDLATRVQNAKFLYHMGKYDEAEAILIQVVKNEPSNRSAPYYLDLIKEARYMDRARRVARANGITAGMPLQGATPSAAANDASGRVPTLTDLLFRRLEDWDHQRVMAESDYLELSNVLFHLNNIPSKKLGGALATAYAHQLDPELVDLAGRLQVAKARMVDASNSYGADMPIFKTAKKQLEDAQTAYQNKIDAVMAGIKTRVNEDKGFMQIIQQKEDEIKNSIMEAQKNRP